MWILVFEVGGRWQWHRANILENEHTHSLSRVVVGGPWWWWQIMTTLENECVAPFQERVVTVGGAAAADAGRK